MRGLLWILNIPAGVDGLLPTNYKSAASQLGAGIRGLRGTTVAATAGNFTDMPCPGTLTLPLGFAVQTGFNAVALSEDLQIGGQVVTNYSLAVDGARLPRAAVPGPAFGQWNSLAGSSIGVGVVDILTRDHARMIKGSTLTLSLDGCLAPRARVAMEARQVTLGPLARA